MSSLKSKFDQIKGTLDEWKLNAQEQACLVGQGTGCALGNDTACAIGVIDLESSAAKHLEERFDAILEIIEKLKSMTADSQYPATTTRSCRSFCTHGFFLCVGY